MKITITAILLLLALCLTGCSSSSEPTVSADPTSEHVAAETEAETIPQEEATVFYLEKRRFDKVVAEEKNFKLYSSDSNKGYYYEIFDNDGEFFDEGFGSWKAGMTYLDKNTVCLQYGTGGMGMFATKYFDVSNRRVSPTFYSPWGAANGLVAYFISRENQEILVVQDMFDSSDYYKEFYSDTFDLSIYTDRGSVEFDFEKQQITVNYSLYPSYEDTAITFDL